MINKNTLPATSSQQLTGIRYPVTFLRNLFMACLFTSIVSCGDMLDVEPENALEPHQVYRDRFDADAAVIGVYGKFLSLAGRYVILNELRADLMDVTDNANVHLRELNEHHVSETNPYADPAPFYEVILHCNDVLKNFDIMRAKHKLDDTEYNERYSDIATLRSWLYLQLVIHYGAVPYITTPFESVEDLGVNDLASLPRLSIEQMVDQLIVYMESLPTKELYSINSTLNTTVDGYNTRTLYINKKFFLGDLYLWKGDYLKAASYYKDVMMTPVPGVDMFDSYRIKYADVSSNNDLAVGYIRYKEQDYYSLIDNDDQGWKSMFIRGQDALFNSEWIWVMPFDSRFDQRTPFIGLFSKTGGNYLVKPSQEAMNLWNAQVQRNGFPWDQRGRFSYDMEDGQPVIKKYIYSYDPLNPLVKDGKWFLGRAALLHLRFAEAANRDSQQKIAWALINPGGIGAAYDDPTETDITKEKDTFLPYPYDFAARSFDVPYFRDTWHRHDGIRGRAYVTALPMDPGNNVNNVTNAEALSKEIEDLIIQEAALELAFEGNRWSDLVRIAIRRNDASFLADKIADKLAATGNPNAEAVRVKLSSRENWFLPFK